MKTHAIIILGLLFTLTPSLFAQDDVIRLKYSDPSEPGYLKAHLINGRIEVSGHNSDEIVIEVLPNKDNNHRHGSDRMDREGLRRVTANTASLTVEEINNRIKIRSTSHNRMVHLVIKVPYRTSLDLKTINDAHIKVDGVDGDHDLTVINGGLEAINLSGSAVAHAQNDSLKVSFTDVSDGAAMAFSSLNGDVDVMLPASTKASLKMNTQNGDIFTGFDMEIKPVIRKTDKTKDKGYRVEFERTMQGDLNGGGPEITMRTMNGDILIRKGD